MRSNARHAGCRPGRAGARASSARYSRYSRCASSPSIDTMSSTFGSEWPASHAGSGNGRDAPIVLNRSRSRKPDNAPRDPRGSAAWPATRAAAQTRSPRRSACCTTAHTGRTADERPRGCDLRWLDPDPVLGAPSRAHARRPLAPSFARRLASETRGSTASCRANRASMPARAAPRTFRPRAVAGWVSNGQLWHLEASRTPE